MAEITGSAPVLLVKDVVQSAAYFRDKLGFQDQRLYNEPTNFAILRRDGIAVMLSQVRPDQIIVPNWKVVEKMWDVYFWVDDVDDDLRRVSGERRDHRLHALHDALGRAGIRRAGY